MTSASDLTRMVPGFDFLQGLLKSAGAGLPNMGQWVAPTLDPQELEKRIQELKTVQFWLEQNARLLATTIQAMEVQRMTLSTLQTMNLPLADISNALRLKPLADAPAPAPAPAYAAAPEPAAPAAPAASAAPAPKARKSSTPAAGSAPAAVDPLQWWGALTQQFTDLANKAVQGTAADATKALAGNLGANLAGAMVKQGVATASGVLKKATVRPAASKRKR